MSDSIITKTSSWLSLAALVFGLFGTIYTAYSFVNGKADSVVTVDDLERHNKDDRAHPSILALIKECDSKLSTASDNIEKAREAQVALGARLVRMLAAEQEPNRNLKAAAASYYEQSYYSMIRKGSTVEEAMLEALRQPWYTKRHPY